MSENHRFYLNIYNPIEGRKSNPRLLASELCSNLEEANKEKNILENVKKAADVKTIEILFNQNEFVDEVEFNKAENITLKEAMTFNLKETVFLAIEKYSPSSKSGYQVNLFDSRNKALVHTKSRNEMLNKKDAVIKIIEIKIN